MGNSDLQNILGELTNVNLVILGISVTIFTVVYSFLLNKKNELHNITNKINQNTLNPFDNQQKYFALNYIKQFSKINRKLLHLIIASFILFLSLFIFNRFLLSTFQNFKELIFYIFCALTTAVLFYFVFTFIGLIKKYKNQLTT